ncbi:Zinc finger protein 385D [Acropora cervicornis]|uniref:Zinc finger protein 385D n=1 Tax=Acropora cervicornis TaxID=6130 RepID=A0AAD9PYR9_ACRCE|nr:Zinc finger protein 385D [Acropora cervicornis]
MAAFGNNTFQHQSRSIFEKNPSTVSYTNPILSTNHSLQTISDTQTLAIERKRKASEQNGCNQLPIKMNATQQFFCEVCNLQLNSLSQAAQHRQGKSHQINVKKNDIFDSLFCEVSKETSGKADISRKCIICNKNFNSNTQAGQHFNGQSHKRKIIQSATVSSITSSCSSSPEACVGSSTQKLLDNLTKQKLEEGKTLLLHHTVMGTNTSEVTHLSENKGLNELYCEFCGLEANSKLQMQMHLQGTKHKNAVTTSALLTACDGTKKGMFYCFQCHMNFNSQSQLEQHTSSHKHQKKVNLRNQIAGQSRQREMTWDCEHGQRGISEGSRGIVSCRVRDGSLVMVPAISTSFITASSPGPHPSNSSVGWTDHGYSVSVINSGVYS